MNKRPISIIFWLKTGTLCWESDDNGAKWRKLFPGSGASDYNVLQNSAST